MEFAKVFDTYKTSDDLEDFIDFDVKKGSIVIVACKDDCVTKMSDQVKQWFSDMGSKYIKNLQYRQSFVFIGRSDSETKKCYE